MERKCTLPFFLHSFLLLNIVHFLAAVLVAEFLLFLEGDAFGVLMPFQERNGILVTFGYLAL